MENEQRGERGMVGVLWAPCSPLMNIFIDASRMSVRQHERDALVLPLLGALSSLPPAYSVCTAMHAGRTRNKLTSNAVHGALIYAHDSRIRT